MGRVTQDAAETTSDRAPMSSDRLKAFADAVVAIAMTLLILPLMDSVGEVAAKGGGAQAWINENFGQLFSFVISFTIIAMFWIIHHRLFTRVEHVSSGLAWITMAWLLSIVWLPVATAMSGQMSGDDALVIMLYVGSMILTTLLVLATRLYLRAHPELHDISDFALRRGMAVDIAMALLFTFALVVALTVPVIGYFALFLMMLTGPVQELIARMLGAGTPRRGIR